MPDHGETGLQMVGQDFKQDMKQAESCTGMRKSHGTCLEDMHAGVDGLEEDHGGLLNLHALCVAIVFPHLPIGALLRGSAWLSILILRHGPLAGQELRHRLVGRTLSCIRAFLRVAYIKLAGQHLRHAKQSLYITRSELSSSLYGVAALEGHTYLHAAPLLYLRVYQYVVGRAWADRQQGINNGMALEASTGLSQHH